MSKVSTNNSIRIPSGAAIHKDKMRLLALDYVTLNPGRYIFPIKSFAKSPPLLKDNLASASNEIAQIEKWCKLYPGCNWGVSLKKSNLFVIDVDTKTGKGGLATFDDLNRQYGFPETEKVRTPSGGFHLYYDGEHVFALGGHGLGEGIDSPNYVLMPGCELSNGTRYVTEKDVPTQRTPSWVYDLVKASKKERVANASESAVELDQGHQIDWAIDFLKNDAEPSREGKGGELQTFKVAASLRDNGISETKCLELMDQYYNIPGACDPEWEIDALAAKIKNAYSYANLSMVGGKTAEADFADDHDETDSIVVSADTKTLEAQAAQRKAAKEEMKRVGDDRPQVEVRPSFLPKSIEEAQDILIERSRKSLNINGGSVAPDQVFQQGGRLVRLSRNLHLQQSKSGKGLMIVGGVAVDHKFQEKNALTIVEVREPWMTTKLDRDIQFVGPSAGKPGAKQKFVPKDAPPKLVKQLLTDDTHWKFPVLLSTTEAPTLRDDGSILDEPGYDPVSGLYYDPGDTKFPKIKADPTEAEGQASIKRLVEELLGSFPFVDQDEDHKGVSLSVALAMTLTGPVRRSLKISPAFAVDSNEPESGKSMLLKTVGALTTGREIAGRPFSENEEERRKSLGTAFMEGRPVLFFDNIDKAIEGPSLEMAITTPMFEDRKLGSHEGITAPTNALVLFSANHIEVGGDGMSTRVLVSRIVPTKPLAQRLRDGDFRHPNLIDWTIANRPSLIADVLTALRAFIVHGRPTAKPTISRFPEWGSLIGNALIWYGYADPTRGGDAVRAADPVKEAMRDVVREWQTAFEQRAATAAELIACPGIRAAIAGAHGERPESMMAYTASTYVKKMVGVGLDLPYRVEMVPQAPGRRNAQKWLLVPTGIPGEADQVESHLDDGGVDDGIGDHVIASTVGAAHAVGKIDP